MKTDSMYNLFVDLLKEIYSSETQIAKLLPEILNHVHSKNLRMTIEKHIQSTNLQIERLKKSLGMLNENIQEETCKTTENFVNEVHMLLQQREASPIVDAGIIALIQRLQHFEIASYGTIRTFANLLNYKEIAKWLNESIVEEGNFDKKLTALAEGSFFSSGINKMAKKVA